MARPQNAFVPYVPTTQAQPVASPEAPVWRNLDPHPTNGPARALQQELERALSGAGEPRWSARRSLGFIVLTNGAFWIAAIWAIRTLLG